MGLEQAIKTRLGTDDAIAAQVRTRIRPMEAAQNDVRPFLVYEVDANEPIGTFRGKASYANAGVTVGVYADTYQACVALASLVKASLDGVAFTVDGQARVAPSRLQEESDVDTAREPGTEQLVYVRTQTYRMLYKAL